MYVYKVNVLLIGVVEGRGEVGGSVGGGSGVEVINGKIKRWWNPKFLSQSTYYYYSRLVLS